MQRDMDLVRQILLKVEDSQGVVDGRTFVTKDISFNMVAYHIEIMEQAGLIEGNVMKAFGGDAVVAQAASLTWAGQDYLDNIRSDNIWEQVKKTAKENGLPNAIDVLGGIAKTLVQATTEVVIKGLVQ